MIISAWRLGGVQMSTTSRLAIRDQVIEAAIDARNAVMPCEFHHTIAARGDRHDLDIQAIDAPERIHMQLRHEAATDESHPDPCHSAPHLLLAAL